MALYKLASQLEPHIPDGWVFVLDVDIDLELAPPEEPGFSRRPDLIVVERREVERVDTEGGMPRASAVLVVVEVVSPGSSRIDNVHKRGEYEDAGIPWYWIVDISAPISMVACHLSEEFGYQDHQRATGTFTTREPYPVTLDLDHLR
jgi:Uma2 family endonuclease